MAKKVADVKTQCANCTFGSDVTGPKCKQYFMTDKPENIRLGLRECPKFDPSVKLTVDIATKFHNSMMGGMFGFVVGDAIGAPVDGELHDARLNDPVDGMRGDGVNHEGIGVWSQTTSLMLAMCDTLTYENTDESVFENLSRAQDGQEFVPYPEKKMDFDKVTTTVLSRVLDGKSIAESSDTETIDNASFPRIFPLGYTFYHMGELSMKKAVVRYTALTHNNAKNILAGVIINLFSFLTLSGLDCDEIIAYVNDFITRNMTEAEYVEVLPAFNRILSGKLFTMEANQIRSSSNTIESLEAALWAAYTSHSFEEAVLNAVNVGGSTSVITALAGGFAGTLYGFENIPNRFVQALYSNKELQSSFEKFTKEQYSKILIKTLTGILTT